MISHADNLKCYQTGANAARTPKLLVVFLDSPLDIRSEFDCKSGWNY